MATESSHYPVLQELLQTLDPSTIATTQPKRTNCGAPDFQLARRQLPIGYVEAKDVGESLDEAQKSEQLKRHRASLANLIVTDYLGFRRYVDGDLHSSACPAHWRGTPK